MFKTLNTLFAGANARAEERVRDVYAIDLIEQKIREAQKSLQAAKATLASLIQRRRAEEKQADILSKRITDLTKRAKLALKDGNETLAGEAAQAIADLENEQEMRKTTLDRLENRILQLQSSVEAQHRRIVDLKQGAISAKAVRQEQQMQQRLNKTATASSSVAEAEELIANVLAQDDPFEQSEILRDIDSGLSKTDFADRMASAGYGNATKSSGADVLAWLKSETKF